MLSQQVMIFAQWTALMLTAFLWFELKDFFPLPVANYNNLYVLDSIL